MDEEGNESSQELHFFYDSQSKPAFVEFEGERYRYIHSLQGDIIAIVDSAGNTVVEYKYDAWGKPISTDPAASPGVSDINPLRYRGYIWDRDIEQYYLRSRYYSAANNRFINADELIDVDKSIIATNVFVYCKNRPVISSDENGHFLKRAIGFIATVIKHVVQAIAAEATLLLNRSRAKNAKNAALKRPTNPLLDTVGRSPFRESTIQGESTLFWFYRMVNTGQPMDYKNAKRRPWWAFYDEFYFRGKMITFEVYGNVNYGYVGKELGIPDIVLYAGGGYAAISSNGDTSGGLECLFDSQEDHDSIAWGISIYKEAWGN